MLANCVSINKRVTECRIQKLLAAVHTVNRTSLKGRETVASDDLARDQVEQMDSPADQARHAILVARFRRKDLQLFRQLC